MREKGESKYLSGDFLKVNIPETTKIRIVELDLVRSNYKNVPNNEMIYSYKVTLGLNK